MTISTLTLFVPSNSSMISSSIADSNNLTGFLRTRPVLDMVKVRPPRKNKVIKLEVHFTMDAALISFLQDLSDWFVEGVN